MWTYFVPEARMNNGTTLVFIYPDEIWLPGCVDSTNATAQQISEMRVQVYCETRQRLDDTIKCYRGLNYTNKVLVCSQRITVVDALLAAPQKLYNETKYPPYFPRNVPADKYLSYLNWMNKNFPSNYTDYIYSINYPYYPPNQNNASFYMDPAIYSIPDYERTG